MDAFIPEVPLVSLGRRGLLSHTSEPRVGGRRSPYRSFPGRRRLRVFFGHGNQVGGDLLAAVIQRVSPPGEDDLYFTLLSGMERSLPVWRRSGRCAYKAPSGGQNR